MHTWLVIATNWLSNAPTPSWLHAIGTEALGQRFAHRAAGNGQHGVPRGGGFGQKLRMAQQPLAP